MDLKKARQEAGLTQQQVADEIGISKRTYCRWEAGEINLENAKNLIKLCHLLGIDLRTIFIS